MKKAKAKQLVEDAVLMAAYRWWKANRPLNFTEKDHLKNPAINCGTGRRARLARAVAKWRGGLQ